MCRLPTPISRGSPSYIEMLTTIDAYAKGQRAPYKKPAFVSLSTPPNDGFRYWIYIGQYANSAWEAPNINLPNSFKPECYISDRDSKGGVYHVMTKGFVYYPGNFVPAGDKEGRWPNNRVGTPISPGTLVKIRSIAMWDDSENRWWATLAEAPRQ
jgi:hypothetical protein